MSAAQRPAPGVHRLIDMVVEEVSLVDRPANKQRFLIVKRDDTMAKSGADKGSGGAPGKGKSPKGPPPKGAPAKGPPAGVEDPKGPEEEDDVAEEAGPPAKPPPKGKKPAKKAEDSSLLSAALSALEGLTEAVELLATVSEDEAAPQLVELSEELDELADQLAQAAGAPPPDTAEDGEDPGGFGPADDGAVGKALLAVRETVKRVRAIVTAAEAAHKADTSAAAGSSGGAVDGATAGGAGQGAATTTVVVKGEGASAELITELKTLRETVQAQQQRIVTLEKGVGLPNSTASDERTGSRSDDDESWPMDMNRPRDRDSVAKDISFHDR